MVLPPPPPSQPSYRPWEDTSPATPPSFLNGRPSLPLPAPSVMTDRRPSISSMTPSPHTHNPRKRRRLSNEPFDRLYPPRVGSSGSPSGVISVDVRSGDGGGGGSMYRRGQDAVGDLVLSSAYNKPLNHNSNHFNQQHPPQPPPPPPPPPQQQPSSLPQSRPVSRPATPQQQFHSSPPPPPPPNALTYIVSSIHNLVIELTGNNTPSPSINSPSQITPHQLPSIEALTTCLETIFTLLNRLKSTSPAQQQSQQNNTTPNEQQAAYTSHLSHLQHSLSTLRLAHSTLNTEHTNLLSAFHRSQTRTSTLDRKLLVCTEETESLANERERLMGVVEGLEESLLEVRTERDDIRLEMRKSGAQWGAIVQNSGKLERGACKVEKALRKEVEGLKIDIERLRSAVVEGGGGCCAAVGEAGERERIELKNRVKELEGRLEELRNEGKGIYELAELISKMGKGIAEPR